LSYEGTPISLPQNLKRVFPENSWRGFHPGKVGVAGVEPSWSRSIPYLAAGKIGELVGTCTLLSRLKGDGFAIKASSSKW